MEIAVSNLAERNDPSTLSDTTTIGLDAGIYDADDTGIIYLKYQLDLSINTLRILSAWAGSLNFAATLLAK